MIIRWFVLRELSTGHGGRHAELNRLKGFAAVSRFMISRSRHKRLLHPGYRRKCGYSTRRVAMYTVSDFQLGVASVFRTEETPQIFPSNDSPYTIGIHGDAVLDDSLGAHEESLLFGGSTSLSASIGASPEG